MIEKQNLLEIMSNEVDELNNQPDNTEDYRQRSLIMGLIIDHIDRNYNEDEEVIINGDGRFFYKTSNFDEIVPYIKNIKRFDLNKLDGIVEEFDELLHKYQYIANMTDRRINKICTLLSSRINKLKRIIESIDN